MKWQSIEIQGGKWMKKILSQMTKKEQIGTLIFILSLIIVQATTGSTLLGFLTGVLGIFYVIFVRMGSKWCYILGGIQMFMYIFIAFHSKFYGDVLLNSINFILQFVGWYNWNKREDSNGIVKPKKLNNKHFYGIVVIWLSIWLIGTYILHLLGGNTPYLDSFGVITSVAAMILSINAYREQWILFMLHNFNMLIMWTFALSRGESNALTMMVMWLAYFLNSILGLYKWYKRTDENDGI